MAAVNGVALGSLDSLLAQWPPDGKREGREWVARNPTRSDTHLGSFKINLSTGAWADFATGDKGGDVVSLYAYLEGVKQGEAAGRLAQELGLNSKPYVGIRPDAQAKWTLLTPVPANTPPPPRAHPRHGQPTRVWTYHDAQGAVLCYVYRFDLQGGKQILPLTFCRNTATGQTTWHWQALPSPRPLYNLDKLTANPQATVIICEGEKAAEACSELFPDCVITTTLNGAQSPHKTDFSPLQGRTVWIWPDNDGPGRKYTEHVTELLKGIAREVKCLHIPGDHPKGWDAYDALREGWQSSAGYVLQDLPQPPLPPVIRGSVAERFKVDDAGVWFHPPEDLAGEDPKPSVWICSPLHVTAYTRNSDGEAWGRLLEFKDAEGQAHTWPMSMEMLAGEGIEYRRMLLSLGLRVAPGRKARDLLTTYIQTARPPAWARCVERTGWQGDAFVLPDEVIGDTGGERVLLQTVNGSHHVYRQAGTLGPHPLIF